MKKMSLLLAALLFPMTAMAVDNIGGCGWGSKVFAGQRGLVPNTLAATSNGSYGTNTFGMTSGTSGCSSDGVVNSNWKTAMFIDGNKSKLAIDMSKGSGESLDSLAQLIGIADADKVAFYRVTKENFAKIFVGEQASSEQIALGLKQVLAADSTLAQYSAAI